MASRGGGGTSVPEPRSAATWLWALVVAPVAAYLVHRLGAGSGCGWDYSAVGGACRAIILLSVISGIVAGILAALAARALEEQPGRAKTLGAVAVLVVVLGTLAAKQFDDYGGGGREMDERMCTWVRETLPNCVAVVWSESDAETVRRAQPGCRADDRSIATYTRCMALEDCKQILDCISGHTEPPPQP